MGWGTRLKSGASIGDEPLKLNGRRYDRGFGDHAQSEHVMTLPGPGDRFEATVGVSDTPAIRGLSTPIRMVFMVLINGRIAAQTKVLCVEDEPEHLSVPLDGATTLTLKAHNPDFPADWHGCPPAAHANWCDLTVTLRDGRTFALGAAAAAFLPERLGSAFVYEGVSFSPAGWANDCAVLSRSEDVDIYRSTYVAPDNRLKLQLTVKVFKDFPVVEWLPELVNESSEPSGVVDDFMSLALAVTVRPPDAPGGYGFREVLVRRSFGSKSRRDDFVAQPFTLLDRYPENRLTMDTDEGRSSAAWLPFIGIDLSERKGFNVGIGWSGAWKATFTLDDSLTVNAGMMRTHFRVLPGETIRQPSIFVHYRDDLSVRDGQNQLRQFILKHHSPHDAAGALIRTPLPITAWGGLPNRETLDILERVKREGFAYDTFWIDAGWYGHDRWVSPTEYANSDWASTVGDWRVNQVPHPGGFRPVADAIHAQGMKFLLWVEIERVMPGTPVALAHPDWLLSTRANPHSLLLNLGRPDVRDWAVETVTRLVRDEGIDHYRQDFNFNTIPYWAEADADDRVGVTEAKYVAGLYAFWDTLRERFPDMLIDNCASGGRRIDFETMSRSICLWRADLLGRPWFDCSEVNHTEVHYLTQWVPLHSGGVTVRPGDDYAFLSGVASGASCSYPEFREGYDYAWQKGMIENARRMMAHFYGDFYPLTDHPENPKAWYAYQCHGPDGDAGFFIAFRRPECEDAAMALQLNAIDPDADYSLETFRGGTRTVKGRELANARIELPSPRSCALCYYRRR